MGSASPQEPEKDMEGYYNLLQAGSELENTLQREYTCLPYITAIFVHKEISFSGCSLVFYVVLQGLCLLFITSWSFIHNLDLVFDNLLEWTGLNLSVIEKQRNSRTLYFFMVTFP